MRGKIAHGRHQSQITRQLTLLEAYMVRHIPVLLVLTSLIIAIVSCAAGTPVSSPTTQPTTPPSPQQTSVPISISNFAYTPPTIEITSGTRVAWTNNDSVVHTVTSNDKVFDSGNMSRNATFSFTFTTAGTYEYYCIPHPYMKGKVIVK